MQFTARDAGILKELAIHRFLRSDRIAQLVGGSRQQVLRRLQLLFHHGYVERPSVQIDRYGRGGSRPIAYGLAGRGASYLRREFDIPFERIHWSRKRDAAKRLFLDHALLISDIATRFSLDCRMDDSIHWSDPRAFHSGANSEPSQWSVTMGGSTSLTVIPDRIFRLRKGDESVLCFLEADCGTMPVNRKTMEQSSILRKLRSYLSTWEQDVHRTLFAEERFRVLFVTTGDERRASMVRAAASLPKGRGLFLFSTVEEITTTPSLLSLQWMSATAAERQPLFRP